MELKLTFRFRGSNKRQYRTASRLKMDGKGRLMLYSDGPAPPECLKLSELRDLSIAWGAGYPGFRNAPPAQVVIERSAMRVN